MFHICSKLVLIYFQKLFAVSGHCQSHVRCRTIDGSCKNLDNPKWAQAGTAQRRLKDINGNPMVDYEDGT